MLISGLSNNGVNKKNFYNLNFASNVSAPRVLNSQSLEASDTFEQSLSTSKKVGLSLVGLAVAVLGAVSTIKHNNTKYLQKAQQMFQDVFMNDKITIEETKNILKRYKELSKIQDKEKYITKLFEETKRNFGLGEKIQLDLLDLSKASNGGGNFTLADAITLNKNWGRKELENAVFHELRHAKQDYFAINYDLETFFKSNGIEDSAKKAQILPFLERKCGIVQSEFSKDNVPEKYHDFVEKCYQSFNEYVLLRKMPDSPEKYKLYKDNFLEIDAWNTANKVTKFLYNFSL